MGKFNSIVPIKYHNHIQDKGGYIAVGDEIFITDNEELAIAILDSLDPDHILILQSSEDFFKFYSSDGRDCGTKSLVEYYINLWFEG